MEINELKALLYRGEKVDLECKEVEHQASKSIYEPYSAFANTNGGTILLGVHENKEFDLKPDFELNFELKSNFRTPQKLNFIKTGR